MKTKTTPMYIFDLDGTLALIEHRRHFVEGKVQRWDKFYAACVADAPNPAVVTMFNLLLASGATVLIFSGRGSEVRTQTLDWLVEHTDLDMPTANRILLMRAEKDYTPDDKLKRDWYEQVLNDDDRKRLVAIFDDRDKVVKMWRGMGLTCFQVAPGAF